MISKNQQGYTLVEVLVSMGIFLTISAIAVGVFTQILNAQTFTVRTQNTAQELRYVQEIISRDVREYPRVNMTACASESLTLSNPDATETVTYRLEDDLLKKEINGGGLDPVTKIEVDTFDLTCLERDDSSGFPNMVTLFIKARGVANPYQLTITSRAPNTSVEE